MKIIEPQSAVLSNAEVLAHLENLSTKRRSPAYQNRAATLKSPNFEAVVKELTSSLAPDNPSPVPPYGNKNYYSVTTIRTVMERLEKFDLTKAELIMIVNLRPQQPVFLDTIVEECDARLTSTKQEEVLSIIGEVLGPDSDTPEETL